MWAQGVQHPCLFSLPSPPPLLSSLSPTLKTVSGTKQVNDLFKIKIITVYFSLSLNIVITAFDTAWWVEKVAICGFLKKIWEEGRELFHPSIHSLVDSCNALTRDWTCDLIGIWNDIQPTGLPAQPKPDVDSCTCGTLNRCFSFSKLQPHKRIRNTTSPINLLGCEGWITNMKALMNCETLYVITTRVELLSS